jgi:hypothetical protein
MPENSRGKRQDRARAAGRRNLSDPGGGFLTRVTPLDDVYDLSDPHGAAVWVARHHLDLITTKQPAAAGVTARIIATRQRRRAASSICSAGGHPASLAAA